jgi:uncharacterized protein YdhG (YjbR/CyaY superfamily)
MKKATADKRQAARRPSGKTIDEYLTNVPKEARSVFDKLRATVRSVVPKEAEEVISYGIPALRMKKVVVWYAAFANHVSLFPTAAIIAEFQNELKGYTTSKGTVQFPLGKPLPLALIKRIVRARVEEV